MRDLELNLKNYLKLINDFIIQKRKNSGFDQAYKLNSQKKVQSQTPATQKPASNQTQPGSLDSKS